MTTLDLIAALIIAERDGDPDAALRILDQLERRLPPDELLDVLASLAGEIRPAGEG